MNEITERLNKPPSINNPYPIPDNVSVDDPTTPRQFRVSIDGYEITITLFFPQGCLSQEGGAAYLFDKRLSVPSHLNLNYLWMQYKKSELGVQIIPHPDCDLPLPSPRVPTELCLLSGFVPPDYTNAIPDDVRTTQERGYANVWRFFHEGYEKTAYNSKSGQQPMAFNCSPTVPDRAFGG